MNKNLGTLDRLIRVILGFALIAFALGLIAPATGYNAFGWVGIVPLVTALVSFCPLYRIAGLSTCGLEAQH